MIAKFILIALINLPEAHTGGALSNAFLGEYNGQAACDAAKDAVYAQINRRAAGMSTQQYYTPDLICVAKGSE